MIDNGQETITARVSGLSHNKEYLFRLALKNRFGESEPSPIIKGGTLGAPGQPTSLISGGESPTSVLLLWKAPAKTQWELLSEDELPPPLYRIYFKYSSDANFSVSLFSFSFICRRLQLPMKHRYP